MSQQLKAHTAMVADPNLAPGTQVGQLTTTHKSIL